MNKIMLVYITHPSEEHAKKIVDVLIEEKLIACANIYPIKSLYYWQGEFENDDEYVSILKTNTELIGIIEKTVLEQHEYEVPCIMHWSVSANESYFNWIQSSCQSKINETK